ncbi:peptidase [Marinomonas sp. S3726]|uniref:tRNA (adenosine(37)-N6)-threonylcarbamoyltransferase complex dimerization subunit type 1 TsaB n=1 Tax=Marinomonas sp. S3726 TaxID=579484 RepID=UPI0005FA754F|nr:tRNA (adenosine(37)-N6)-threonylcarbamoyltransferase complex dimerization subunit type 1 TsaB [Marinomonas sp. S3726]KJZ11012.1 peptidase [Marinomonas sp. S3726]
MTAILALDTSTPACSVALLVDGVLMDDFRLAPRKHNELILPMVDQMLTQAQLSLSDLDAIAFARGPGSFTGLRIAAGVVQGLAYGTDLPVIPVSTLAALALDGFQQTGDNHWLAALDARMGEVYLGGYEFSESGGSLVVKTSFEETVIKPDLLSGFEKAYQGIGSGWCYQETLSNLLPSQAKHILEDAAPKASCIVRLAEIAWQKGETVAAHEAVPTYLRDEISWEKQPLKVGKR